MSTTIPAITTQLHFTPEMTARVQALLAGRLAEHDGRCLLLTCYRFEASIQTLRQADQDIVRKSIHPPVWEIRRAGLQGEDG